MLDGGIAVTSVLRVVCVVQNGSRRIGAERQFQRCKCCYNRSPAMNDKVGGMFAQRAHAPAFRTCRCGGVAFSWFALE